MRRFQLEQVIISAIATIAGIAFKNMESSIPSTVCFLLATYVGGGWIGRRVRYAIKRGMD